jgi:hypothetical protein
MMMTKEIRNVKVIFDRDHGRENEGWYIRHDEYVDGELSQANLDNGIDAASESEAVAAAVRYFGGAVVAEQIEVIA